MDISFIAKGKDNINKGVIHTFAISDPITEHLGVLRDWSV
jgi:hypothetical protein